MKRQFSTQTPSAILRSVRVIHRHGDRTPISPLQDTEFWASTLPSTKDLELLGKQCIVLSHQNQKAHPLGGDGVFGSLTKRGVQQLTEVGKHLRSVYVHQGDKDSGKKTNTTAILPENLDPTKLTVFSTFFPRTIQSVQALLSGLYPIETRKGGVIAIDARQSDFILPDPIPRLHPRQSEAEEAVWVNAEILEREKQLQPLREKVARALVSRGFIHAKHVYDNPIKAWSQFSEILTCLSAHSHPLFSSASVTQPPSASQLKKVKKAIEQHEWLTPDEITAVTAHATWRWYQLLSCPTVSLMAMGSLVRNVLLSPTPPNTTTKSSWALSSSSPFTIYSAHDSSIIGFLCMVKNLVHVPELWPPYASVLCVEKWEGDNLDNNNQDSNSNSNSNNDLKKCREWVRFSLNGKVMKSLSSGSEWVPNSDVVDLFKDHDTRLNSWN